MSSSNEMRLHIPGTFFISKRDGLQKPTFSDFRESFLQIYFSFARMANGNTQPVNLLRRKE
jgi:hypothetical protein